MPEGRTSDWSEVVTRDKSLLLFLDGFETKLLLKRIDGAIQVRSSVDPTFYSLVGSGRSEGTTTAPLFSIIHTSLISVWTTITRAQVYFWLQWENKMEHLTTYLHRPRTTRSPFSFWGDGGIVPFELFFHDFPGGPEKAAINKIFLILPSRNKEREIRFPFHRD
ncbi:hypothetical protein E1A91_D10G213100v1 [Gossypium mustelinum]|uniref:Uncharacterized protein ycf68 n=1 Tax=Gossypium mustelinum TaxID=34275 RepID=A0A5D2TAW0_GOSMU|nr:hypothetical protein E1A91_D10G213100v1 [Gossypium mustelinum]